MFSTLRPLWEESTCHMWILLTKGQWYELWVFLCCYVSLHKLLNKQSICRWFVTSWQRIYYHYLYSMYPFFSCSPCHSLWWFLCAIAWSDFREAALVRRCRRGDVHGGRVVCSGTVYVRRGRRCADGRRRWNHCWVNILLSYHLIFTEICTHVCSVTSSWVCATVEPL